MEYYEGYEKAEVGDIRLGKRLARILEQLAGDPAASISAASGDPYQAKAAYRFLSNDDVSVEAITEITRIVTLKNINETKPPVLLVLQDTTELNFSSLKATKGLGSISGRSTASGIEVHSSVAVGEAGEMFGLLAQKLWVRPPENFGQSTVMSKKLPIEEKESYKWLESLEKVGTDFPESTNAVYVCDREADIYEFFCKAEKEGVQFLCRRRSDRNIEGEDGLHKLDEFISAQPVAGTIIVRVPRDSHTNRIERDAEVAIKFGKCRISKPQPIKGGGGLPKSIEVYVVSATEADPPQGQERIFWQLITNVPTKDFYDALTRVQWYTQRWKIETFHRTLKSGCKVEKLQSGTAEKLMKLVAIYSIIALQIMQLCYIARTRPDESCEICLTEDEWKILHRAANKTRSLPEKPPTIHEAVVMIAKLGGFLSRKSDGFPGVTVIWRGLTKYYTILDVAPFIM